MSTNHEQLMAYVDGELDAAAAREVEAAIAADPRLAAEVARQRALRDRLRAALAPALDEPVPERLRALLEPAPAPSKVVPLRPAATAAAPARRWRLPEWSAMAASLLLGVAVSQLALQEPAGPVRSAADGRLVAAGELARRLQDGLAAEPAPGSAVQLGLSFRTADGATCRTFGLHQPGRPLAGLACRGAEGWALPVLVESEAAGGELRQAAVALPAAVLAAVDARIEGEPFDADQERRERDRGWR